LPGLLFFISIPDSIEKIGSHKGQGLRQLKRMVNQPERVDLTGTHQQFMKAFQYKR